MTDRDHIEALLASGPIIEDLLDLAKGSSPKPKLQVLTLACALAQAAVEGEVPDSYVLDAVRSALTAARTPGAQPL